MPPCIVPLYMPLCKHRPLHSPHTSLSLSLLLLHPSKPSPLPLLGEQQKGKDKHQGQGQDKHKHKDLCTFVDSWRALARSPWGAWRVKSLVGVDTPC